MGFTNLEVEFTPTSEPRWVDLIVDIPDDDAQSGRGFVNGYRICRGGC